jgi:iron complex outermembrane receptor protein
MLQTFSLVTDTAGTTNSSFFGAATRTDARSGELNARVRLETGDVKHQIVLAATDFQSDISNYQPSISGGYVTNIYNPVIVPQPGDANLNGPLTRLSETAMRSYAFTDTLSIFDDRLLLTLGVRHQNVLVDSFNFATGAFEAHYDESKVTPALAALVKVTDAVSLYANYVEGLSQGPTAPPTAVNANEVFAPFVSKQGEVGVKVDWGQLTSTLSAFQVTRPSGFLDASNVFTVEGEQRNRGLELQVFGELSPGVRLLGGAAATDAVLTNTQNPAFEGNRAGGVPEWQLKIGGEWDIPSLRGVTATARVVHTGPQAFNAANTLELPAWTRLDLGARYTTEIETRPVTFRFSVENVTDNRYWDSEPGYLVATYAMPRTYLFSVSADF